MSAHRCLLLLITMCVSIQGGVGSPLKDSPESDSPGSIEEAPPHRVRTKRCACNNQLDSECHYFCHLDIIWVNTPSKTTVYGLGSPLARRRRSTGRCACANSADHTCASFCLNGSEISSSNNSMEGARSNLRKVLRTVVRVSGRLRGLIPLQRVNPPKANRHNER